MIEDVYPQIVYTLRLRRKPLYYVVTLIIPCCLLSFVAVGSFLLQPNCYDRLGLSTYALVASVCTGLHAIIVKTQFNPLKCTGVR